MTIYEVAMRAEYGRDLHLEWIAEVGSLVKEYKSLSNHFRIASDLPIAELEACDMVIAVTRGDSEVKAQQDIAHDGDFRSISNGNWGLARIVSRNNPWFKDRRPFTLADFPATKTFSPLRDGTGVDVYLCDTGIAFTDLEFGSRASSIFTISGDGTDDGGHGTLVASIIGGVTYGVAKNCNLFSAKVLDSTGTGTISDIIDGINACLVHYNTRSNPAVMNLSFFGTTEGTYTQTLFDNLSAAGIIVCICAGNDFVDIDTTTYYPASFTKTITVGASNIFDQPMYQPPFFSGGVRDIGSNYGDAVEIYAPGAAVVGQFNDGVSVGPVTTQGTSMSTAFVSGVCAAMLQGRTKLSTETAAAAFRQEVINNATEHRMNPPLVGPARLIYLDPTDDPAA